MIGALIGIGMFWAIAVGLPLGTAVAVGVLARFRARVARSIRETARKDARREPAREITEASAATSPAGGRSSSELTVDLARSEEVLAAVAIDAKSGPAGSAKRQARQVALVYGAAASVLVLIMVNTLRFVSPYHPSERILFMQFLYFAAFVWVFATPAVLAATYVIRKQIRYLALAVLGLLAVVWLWDLFMYKGSLFILWLWYSAAPTAVALLLATRRLRAVGPIAVVGIAVWSSVSSVLILVGALYALDVMGLRFVRPDLQDLSLFAAAQKYLAWAGQRPLGDFLTSFSAIWSGSGRGLLYVINHPEHERAAFAAACAWFLISFIAGAVAAWDAVTWLASRSRRRRVSDQMLTIDVMVLVYAAYLFMIYFGSGMQGTEPAVSGSSQDRSWIAITTLAVAAFIAYKLAATAGLRFLRRSRPSEPARTLLLLRVFGFDRRTQRLLDDLGQRWRYLGPIRLLAGPDLAYSTIEPHEFYDFISGRLSRAFVKDRKDSGEPPVVRRAGRRPRRPLPDRRFLLP